MKPKIGAPLPAVFRLIEDVEYATLICCTCQQGHLLLLIDGHPIEEYVRELGHEGHNWHVQGHDSPQNDWQ